jgi:hypothetical protein
VNLRGGLTAFALAFPAFLALNSLINANYALAGVAFAVFLAVAFVSFRLRRAFR